MPSVHMLLAFFILVFLSLSPAIINNLQMWFKQSFIRSNHLSTIYPWFSLMRLFNFFRSAFIWAAETSIAKNRTKILLVKSCFFWLCRYTLCKSSLFFLGRSLSRFRVLLLSLSIELCKKLEWNKKRTSKYTQTHTQTQRHAHTLTFSYIQSHCWYHNINNNKMYTNNWPLALITVWSRYLLLFAFRIKYFSAHI